MKAKPRPKVNVVVVMHGGCIEDVLVDSKDVRVGRVVFTEARKYVDKDVTLVRGGALDGECIFTVMGARRAAEATVGAALDAAKRYVKDQYDEPDGEGDDGEDKE